MKKYLLSAALVLAVSAANATPFRTAVNSTNDSSNGAWAFGTIFTVGPQSLDVTSLGAYDSNKDGFSSGSIQVGIFDELTHSLLASTNVQSSNTLVGDYRYASINDLVLNSGQQYRLVAVSGGDAYDLSASQYATEIKVNGFGYCSATSLTMCSDYTDGDFGFANFQFGPPVNNPPSGDVPEPASLALLGLGAALVGVSRRRK